MGAAYVVSQDEALGVRESGDSAVVMETIGPLDGCELLTQRVIHFIAGRSHPRRDLDHDDLLFVVSGAGTCQLPTGTHRLDPERRSTSPPASRPSSRTLARTTS